MLLLVLLLLLLVVVLLVVLWLRWRWEKGKLVRVPLTNEARGAGEDRCDCGRHVTGGGEKRGCGRCKWLRGETLC